MRLELSRIACGCQFGAATAFQAANTAGPPVGALNGVSRHSARRKPTRASFASGAESCPPCAEGVHVRMIRVHTPWREAEHRSRVLGQLLPRARMRGLLRSSARANRFVLPTRHDT